MPESVRQFTENLIASGVITQPEFDRWQAESPSAQQAGTPKTLAQLLIKSGLLTEFQAKAVLQGKTKGLVYGDYVVLDRIGAGGMGVVLKARHRRMDRLVALKVLPAKAMKSPDAVERFYREVKAAAKLSHPNVVAAYDAGESDGTHYFVMEYVEGQDLANLVKKQGPLPVDQAIDYMTQAARGLQYAHDQGIVHRDIKPANLLLDASSTVKILDMGLARFEQGLDEEDRDRLTQSGQVMGTCDYMAPEQAEDTHRADRRADVYSLGCSLYRLLTGRAMYTGDSLVTILLAHRDQPIPSLAASRQEVSAQLDTVYQRMVAKRPEDRYQTMTEVVGALESCRQALPVGGSGDASAPAERSDSKLNAFLKGFSPANETIQRQVDMETGQIEPPPAGVRKKAQPGWLYGVVGAAVVLAVTLGIAFLIGSGDEQHPAQLAKAPQASSPEPSESDSAEQEEPEQPAELTATTVAEEPAISEAAEPEGDPSEMPAETATVHQPEAQARTEDAKPSPPEPTPPTPQADPAAKARQQLLEAQRAADAKYVAAMKQVEDEVVEWDFLAAWQASEKIAFEEPVLRARLESRRDEIRRMEMLRRRIITKIAEADPPLEKSDLKIRGIGGKITDVGPAGITTRTIRGKVERLTWKDLGAQAAGKLVELVVDRKNSEDCIAAGLLASASGDRLTAEKLFEQAKIAGADISAQRETMAALMLTEASNLLARDEFREAASLLEELQSKHADLAWFQANEETYNAAVAIAIQGVREIEANELLAEATSLHRNHAYFDMRDALKRLQEVYAGCRALTDTDRSPSFSSLWDTVTDLGEKVLVRPDGSGDFLTIQAAIDAVPARSLVEIAGSGPYRETLVIPEGKNELTIRGADGAWPIVTSLNAPSGAPVLIQIDAAKTIFDQIVFDHGGASGNNTPVLAPKVLRETVFRRCIFSHCLDGSTLSYVSFDTCLIHGPSGVFGGGESFLSKDCIWLSPPGFVQASARFENTLAVKGLGNVEVCELRHCTFPTGLQLKSEFTKVTNCIARGISTANIEGNASRIEYCNVYGDTLFTGTAKAGVGCFAADPQFINPRAMDYRLSPTSPCRGRASDGSDVGCHITAAMAEMLRLDLDLVQRQIIKF